MLKKIENIFLCNGFEPDKIRAIRSDLVDTTIDGMKKLAMGIGSLYLLAMIVERNRSYIITDIVYLVVFSIFLLMVNVFQRTKNYKLAEFATLFFVIATLWVAIYDSTVLAVNSRGVYFLIYLVLIAVMFTGNPLVIDILMLIMTIAFLVMSFRVKEISYFKEDLFTGLFTLLACNMVNAMISRSRINAILKTNEVEESRTKYEFLYDSVPCGIVEYTIADGKQKLVDINQQGLRVFGTTKEEMMLADDLRIAEKTHPEDRKQIEDSLASLKCVGDKANYEYRLQQKNGAYIWVVGQIQVTEVTEDTITVLSACIDIDAEKKAIDANEAKSKFLSRMSHDIRTPMNAIIGLTNMVLDNPALDRETKENMLSIKSSSTFLLGLINDILDVSKIEADEMTLHPEPYFREEFINYLDTMIRPLCEQKGIEFDVDATKTNHDYVLLDKVRFNQVFFNLLSNAVKFTPRGGRVGVVIEHVAESDTSVTEHIIISDTGIGMSKEFQKHMFDPFSQEDKEHVNESQGSGLGLSIVRRVIDLMGGTLELESELNKGTTFHIYLDMELCEGEEERTLHFTPEELAGKRVLICEDHPINRKIAESLLQKVQMIPECVSDGAQGVQQFEQSQPAYYDAILMDIRMPNMNGLEATRKIRGSSHPDAKRIPIIAMTANVFDTDRRESMNAGMNDHIAKPIEPEILYQVLAKYLSETSNEETCGIE